MHLMALTKKTKAFVMSLAKLMQQHFRPSVSPDLSLKSAGTTMSDPFLMFPSLHYLH